ncbi:MAG: oxidoreductase [Acidimicrobiia bacterium]|nr:MAG: oxidoreductase [Acidimicrobiia bacterium]
MVTKMETTGLGPFQVGRLAFGCWRFVGHDLPTAVSIVETALECGMNLVDTADVYGLDWGGEGFGAAEELLGRVLRADPAIREAMVVATKGGIVPGVPYDSSPGHLRAACEASLRRLGVDVIDLYQIHRPDLYTHPAEVAETLEELVSTGKVRSVGVSNYLPHQVEALQAHLDIPLVSIQPEFSVVHLDPMKDGTLDLCMRLDMTPLVWSPLGGGRVVTGDGMRTELTVTLDGIAARHGVDRSEVALAFVLAHPSRPVAILGTQNPDRLRRSVRVFEVALTRSDLYEILEAAQGEPLP